MCIRDSDRAQQSNFGEWYWGGQFCIPHEVCQNESGELDVKLPREYVEAWLEPVEWSYEHKLGKFRTYGDKCIYLDSVSTLSDGFIKVKEKSFLFSCKVKPVSYTHLHSPSGSAGLWLWPGPPRHPGHKLSGRSAQG